MKVGVILTGYSRRYKECCDSVKRFLNTYDTDVYISTWNKTQSSINTPFIYSVDVNEIIQTYKPVNYHIQDYDEYYRNRFQPIDIYSKENNNVFRTDPRAIEHGSKWVERLRDQWYIVKHGWNLIDNPSKYDYIIRLRLDTILHNLVLKETDDLIVPNKFNPHINSIITTDHLAIGNPINMEQYCRMFNSIDWMYYNHNIDISNAELMLGHYLINICDIKVTPDPTIDYDILK
jgi:hypothetical protein